MQDLYSELLLEHSKNKQIKEEIPEDYTIVTKRNCLCGDTCSVGIKENPIQIKVKCNGCALCQASSSVLLDLTKGKNKQELKTLVEEIKIFLTDYKPKEELKDLNCFSSLKKFPTRKTCVNLPWQCLEQVLTKSR